MTKILTFKSTHQFADFVGRSISKLKHQEQAISKVAVVHKR